MSVLRDLFPPLKDDLKVLGPEVFGAGWKYRLAAHCDIAVRTVHRWCDPKEKTRAPPVELINWLRDQAETLQTLRLSEQINAQLRHQVEIGQLHPDVIAAMLSDLAESFKTALPPKDKRSPKE